MRSWISLWVLFSIGVATCGVVAGALVAGDSAAAGLNPLADISLEERGERLQGHAAEIVSAGSYTYLDLAIEGGERRWVVLLGRPALARGSAVTVTVMGSKRGFRSRKLGRVFDELTFAYQSN
ncbi:MAG: hypothetical protein Tsb0020_21820 [Haliangiales bacterium]